jgi:hypothetical protein
LIPILKNGFLAPKTLLYPLRIEKEAFFFPTFSLMTLQKVWNECLKFGDM